MSDQIVSMISELEKRVEKLEQALLVSTHPVSPRRAQLSVVEFLRDKKPSSTVEKALIFAVYHEDQSGKDVFNTDDILLLWRQAKETPPSNINDLINKNIKKGFMAEEKVEKGQRKCWYVTSSGIDAVGRGFVVRA